MESDGTERVEGSMTQRLENILNSKHPFIRNPSLLHTKPKYHHMGVFYLLTVYQISRQLKMHEETKSFIDEKILVMSVKYIYYS